MATRPAPYATHIDVGKQDGNTAVSVPSPTAPWEKDQSSRNPVKGKKDSASQIQQTTISAPYGTSENFPVLVSPQKIITKSAPAPFGTSSDVPAAKGVLIAPQSPPFGTVADMEFKGDAAGARSSAPWERDESKYTHKGKTGFGSRDAPYATESSD